MTTEHITIRSIAEMVLLRPKMFTANGSLAEVLAFLDGCNIMERHADKGVEDNSSSVLLKWVQTEVEMHGKGLSPIDRIEAMLERHGSERRVLRLLKAKASEQRQNGELAVTFYSHPHRA